MLEHHATQSRFSDPGRHADWLDGTPADIERLILWDVRGSANVVPEVSGPDAARADELAAVDPNDQDALCTAFEADDVRVPPVIRSVNPITRAMTEVTL